MSTAADVAGRGDRRLQRLDLGDDEVVVGSSDATT
jgi:hypothetical protein